MDQKILFLDLDGTLLNDSKEITPDNYDALRGVLARGHRVVITTGRPLKSSIRQAEKLGLTGPGCYLIAYNGAVVYDCSRREQVFCRALPRETVGEVFDEANRRGIHIQTYDTWDVLVEARNDNESVRRYCGRIGMDFRVIDDVHRDLTEDPVKALLIDFDHKEPLEEMERWLRTHMAGRVDVFFSCDQYLEVVPVGMNKGSAVVDMCRRLGVDLAQAVAVGDAENDISMIRAAGTGVAMANGIPEVKAAADYVTRRDNNHGAIAEVIERFLT